MRSSVGHVVRICERIFPGHVMPPFACILSAASPSIQKPLLPGTRQFASMLKFGDGMLNLSTTHITMRGMSSVSSPSGSGAVGNAGRIFDVTGANFPQVVESSTTPVIIVCYVPEEGGISNNIRIKFEAEVSKAAGVVLGRLDVEKQQELAMQLQLQEIPTIFAIYEKKVVNKISGSLKDTEIAGFVANAMHLAKLATGDAMIREAADLLTNGDIQEALAVYGSILKNPQSHSEAIRVNALAGMVMCALALGDLEGAKDVAASLRENHKLLLLEPLVKQALTAVDMAVAAQDCGDQSELENALLLDGNDHETRHKLAILLHSKGDSKGAMRHALEIIKRDRNWNENGGKKLLLQFFETLGSQHPDVNEARKRLSALLFI